MTDAQAPIPIDRGRQLFVDDHLIAETDLRRTFHKPVFDPAAPVLYPITEAEINSGVMPAAAMASILYDPRARCYKAWYLAGYDDGFAYATSRDGLEWQRPDLSIVPGTNRFLTSPRGYVRNGASVCLDHDAQDPRKRFKMFAFHRAGTGTWPRREPVPLPEPAEMAHLYTSPDGVQWTERARTGPCGDNTSLFRNPFRGTWAYSVRTFDGRFGRARRYYEHPDFVASAEWQPADLMPWLEADTADRPDPALNFRPELYKVDCVAYESVMIGLFGIYRGPPNHIASALGVPKTIDLVVGFSRDGLSWDRPDRTAFVASSREEGTWNRGYLHASGGLCVIVGDELRFYITGFSGISPAQVSGPYAGGSIGIARLRRDGFASMDGPGIAMPPVTRTGSRRALLPDYVAPSGSLTTHPVQFSGRQLFVNARVVGGDLRVEVLDANGVTIEGFSRADCRAVEGDSTKCAVTWRSGHLAKLAGRPVRFRFWLASGELYAFWVSNDERGASHGYVAAGGPGFDGATDTTGA